MFIHNFKYSLKTLFRNKTLIFWSFLFPIILGTFFKMAFANIENSEKLAIINIAIIDNKEFQNNQIFVNAFKDLSDVNNPDRLFKTKYTTLEEAKKLLENKEIVGYLYLENNTPKLTFTTSGINETIFKNVVEEINQMSNIITNLMTEEIKKEITNGNYNLNYENIYNKVKLLTTENNIRINNISNRNLSYTMIEFYTLIAMTCLYGAIFGNVALNQKLANMTNEGKRIAISPTTKSKIILSSILASFLIELTGLFLLFLYTVFILKVDYGNNLGLIVLLGVIGSLAGLTLGICISACLKANDNLKTGVIISVTILGCFLSGMQGVTMKYLVDKNIPLINKLNPASMITDGFYALYYYDTLDRYIFNIISLLIFSVILIIISCLSLRREKYDSI